MYKLLIIITTLLPITLSAQIHPRIQDTLWKEGNSKTIWGYKITRLKSSNTSSGVLNIAYKTHEQYIKELQNTITKQKWTPEEITFNTNRSLDTAKGGFIHVYLTSEFPNQANTYNLTITIKDSGESELYSKQMPNLFAKMPPTGSIMWWNYNYIAIPVTIDTPFYVYVNDSYNPQKVYKYKIEEIDNLEQKSF